MTLRAAAEQALEALDDMIERVAFACGENAYSASFAARPIAEALRAALEAEQPQPEAGPAVLWMHPEYLAGRVNEEDAFTTNLPAPDGWVPLCLAHPTAGFEPKAQPAVGVQACRPEDRAMLATPAGAELVAKVAQALAVPKAVATAPERIWLQIGDSRAHMDEPFPGDGATWCADSVVDAEVEYVRADLAPPPSAPCPHIRSSGVGDHATHWCALNGPPAVPEPSEAEVDAACQANYGDEMWSNRELFPQTLADMRAKMRAALRAAAAARGK